MKCRQKLDQASPEKQNQQGMCIMFSYVQREREIGWLTDLKQLIPVIVQAIPKPAGQLHFKFKVSVPVVFLPAWEGNPFSSTD